MPTTSLPTGTVVDRYRIEGVIGAGSMGDVVRGVDVDLQRQVAIKILSERHRENDELRARFVREARAVAAISHPNVVQVFTTGTYDDRPYIAMELLRGVDLGTVVKERGTMTSLQAARAVLDGARGLEAAAKAGLIHRDVKPSNLVLLEDGLVKVTDFGLAKPLDPSSEPALTAMGVVVCTPYYIAPEQARGDPIDERVDIYALGGTLYYLLTAAPPFRTGIPAEDKYLKVVARHLKEPPPNPRDKNKTADPDLAVLVAKMMSKRAGDRPDYAQLGDRLSALIQRLQAGGADGSQPEIRTGRAPSQPAPTPFVGGQERLPPELASADGETGAPADRARGEDESEAAATLIRRSSSSRTGSGAPAGAQPGPTRWLIAVTVLSVLIFLTGLGLLLFGPMPSSDEEESAAPLPDAGASESQDAAAAAPAPPPEAPEGFFLVERPDGSPWFFCAERAVRHGAYAELFPGQKEKHRWRKRNRRPVVKVSFSEAEKYARAVNGRLLTPEEWEAASRADAFQATGDLWEWVDDGARGVQAPRQVRSPSQKPAERRPTGHIDVTFRVARDLE